MTQSPGMRRGTLTTGTLALVQTNEERLETLAASISANYDGMKLAADELLSRAVAIGEALLEAKELVAPGGWLGWVDANLPGDRRLASNYMRLASQKEHLNADLSIAANLNLLRGRPTKIKGRPQVDPALRERADELNGEGVPMREIARQLGVSYDTVKRWLIPGFEAKRRQRSNERRRKSPEDLSDLDMADDGLNARAVKYGAPGRASIGKAVQALARAERIDLTIDALEDLLVIAGAWQATLLAVYNESRVA